MTDGVFLFFSFLHFCFVFLFDFHFLSLFVVLCWLIIFCWTYYAKVSLIRNKINCFRTISNKVILKERSKAPHRTNSANANKSTIKKSFGFLTFNRIEWKEVTVGIQFQMDDGRNFVCLPLRMEFRQISQLLRLVCTSFWPIWFWSTRFFVQIKFHSIKYFSYFNFLFNKQNCV